MKLYVTIFHHFDLVLHIWKGFKIPPYLINTNVTDREKQIVNIKKKKWTETLIIFLLPALYGMVWSLVFLKKLFVCPMARLNVVTLVYLNWGVNIDV